MGDPRWPDPGSAAQPELPGVDALLDRIARALDIADLDAATEALSELAVALPAAPPDDPASGAILGRALWLAALVSLGQGRLEEFVDTSTDAIAALEAAGDDARGADARAAQREILERIERALDVRARGALGFLDALDAHAARLLQVAAGDAGWAAVDRDRAQLAELARAPADASGRAQPFARLVVGLGLDPVDIAAVALLVPLANRPQLAEAAHRLLDDPVAGPGFRAGDLAALAFARDAVRATLVDRLAPGAPLVRRRVVDVVADGPPDERRVAARADLLWFLRDLPLVDLPRPPGLDAWVAAPGDVPLMAPLAPARARIATALRGERPPVVVASGSRGAGKATVALAAAAEAGRPLLVVDPELAGPGGGAEAVAVGVRDALLNGAALMVRLDREPVAIGIALDEPRVPLVLAVDHADAADALPELRKRRADMVVVEVPPLPEAEQAAVWMQGAASLVLPPLDQGEVEAQLVRPGLLAGDVAGALVAAAAAAATGVVVDTGVVAAGIDARLASEMARVAEVIEPGPAPALDAELASAVDAVAVAIQAGTVEVDSWGIGARQSGRPAHTSVAVVGAVARDAGVFARALAAALGTPLARLDARELSATGGARVDALASIAGRARAVVWVEHAEAAVGRAARAVASAMTRAPSTWLVSPSPGVALPPGLFDAARVRVGSGGEES